MRMHRLKAAAFTLIEIMIVVSIIGLLAVIALPATVRARTRSQAHACISNLRHIEDATQEWALENNKAPNATVAYADIQDYLKRSVTCPVAGGNQTFDYSYQLNTVSNQPTCRLVPADHLLPGLPSN